jgi:hypothetical protein
VNVISRKAFLRTRGIDVLPPGWDCKVRKTFVAEVSGTSGKTVILRAPAAIVAIPAVEKPQSEARAPGRRRPIALPIGREEMRETTSRPPHGPGACKRILTDGPGGGQPTCRERCRRLAGRRTLVRGSVWLAPSPPLVSPACRPGAQYRGALGLGATSSAARSSLERASPAAATFSSR